MAQGKLKTKAKLPDKAKKNTKKGKPATQRSNRPIQPKKKGLVDAKKLKQTITKTVNKTIEEEIRARASSEHTNLSNAQKAVADFNKKVEQNQS